jgi:hypothetical protein
VSVNWCKHSLNDSLRICLSLLPKIPQACLFLFYSTSALFFQVKQFSVKLFDLFVTYYHYHSETEKCLCSVSVLIVLIMGSSDPAQAE